MIQLASLFKDHAVLQCDTAIPCWGWTQPNTSVLIELAEHTVQCMSNDRGAFFAKLPAMAATHTALTLTVSTPENGASIQIQDLLIGEVWIASGQSNMQWTTSDCSHYGETSLKDANYPEIRLFEVENRAQLGEQCTCQGYWQACAPETAKDFSAVGFAFARKLHTQLQVPVGIISSAWGGTPIEAWMSDYALAGIPEIQSRLNAYHTLAYSPKRWTQQTDDANADGLIPNLPVDAGNTGFDAGYAAPQTDTSGWPTLPVPCRWQHYNHPYSGVFWMRTTIDLPPNYQNQTLTLHLGTIDKIDTTYANGVEIGRTGKDHEQAHWNQPRNYTIPAELTTGTSLTIAVRVVSFSGDGGITGPHPRILLQDNEDTGISIAHEWHYQIEQNYGAVVDEYLPGQGCRLSPHMLYDNMIAPLVPYAIRGFIWYQGEHNTRAPKIYAALQSALIEDWRRAWKSPELAFNLVQLPNHGNVNGYVEHSNWAQLRQSQCDAAQRSNAGLAISIDLGDPSDIHPHNKTPVGERLARIALSDTYGHTIEKSGPMLAKASVHANRVHCQFDHCAKGLCVEGNAELNNVYLAGSDHVFHRAQACFTRDTIEVSSPEVTAPTQIAYAWCDSPEPGLLFNSEGLPASPFLITL